VTNLTVGEGIEKAGTSLGAGLAAFGKGIGKRREEERKKSKLEQSIVESEDLIESALERLDIDPKSKEGQFIKSGSIDPKTGLVDFQKFSAGVKIKEQAQTLAQKLEAETELLIGKDIAPDTPTFEQGRLRQEFKVSEEERKIGLQKAKEVDVEKQKRVQQAQRDVLRANFMLLRSQENFANMVRRQKQINPNFQASRLGGFELLFSGLTGQNEFVRVFKGDLTTTAITLAKIAAPSSRPGPEFEKLMERTLNDVFSLPVESTEQLLQSATDAFERGVSEEPDNFLTPEQLKLPLQGQMKILRGHSVRYKNEMRKVFQSILDGTEFNIGNAIDKTTTTNKYDINNRTFNFPAGSEKEKQFLELFPNAKRI